MGKPGAFLDIDRVTHEPVSYTHLTVLQTISICNIWAPKLGLSVTD